MAMGHWSGSRPLASATHLEWAVIGAPLGYLLDVLCREDPTVLDMEVCTLHMLLYFRDQVAPS